MAKKSGQLAELVSLAKLSDDSTTLEEIRASTLDQIQLVESITKQTSVLQLNMERCKSLIDSNAQLQKLRAGAQQAKLAKGQAAKAQLEEMVPLTLRQQYNSLLIGLYRRHRTNLSFNGLFRRTLLILRRSPLTPTT